MATATTKVNLLLVDDKPANLVALEAVLQGPEYNLLTAQSGKEALKILDQQDVALILLDVQMPEMDGFETARRIKQIARCRETPIIFITAIYREDEFVRKGYQAGAIDYFSKPFDPEILKLKVSLYASFQQKTFLLRERERRIRESEELLQAGRKLSAILEDLSVGVIIADAAGRICQTNETVNKIWRSDNALTTDAYGDFLGWWDKSGKLIRAENGPLARALASGKSSHNEVVKIRSFDGIIRTVLTSASPLHGLDNKIVGVVLVIQDITEHKKIEEDMEQRIMKLVTLGVEFEQTARQ